MACLVQESHRTLKPGALLFMINDNVCYTGITIPVDILLCDFARKMGFDIQNILVLPGSKGNSSQQMGIHAFTYGRRISLA